MQALKRTVVNAAHWHYERALFWWERYQSCLNDDGLYHPNDIPKVKTALREFRLHMQIADGILSGKRLGRFVSHKVNYDNFADDFELALIQRGNQAKQAFLKEHPECIEFSSTAH